MNDARILCDGYWGFPGDFPSTDFLENEYRVFGRDFPKDVRAEQGGVNVVARPENGGFGDRAAEPDRLTDLINVCGPVGEKEPNQRVFGCCEPALMELATWSSAANHLGIRQSQAGRPVGRQAEQGSGEDSDGVRYFVGRPVDLDFPRKGYSHGSSLNSA